MDTIVLFRNHYIQNTLKIEEINVIKAVKVMMTNKTFKNYFTVTSPQKEFNLLDMLNGHI